jgi:hypothetical protein
MRRLSAPQEFRIEELRKTPSVESELLPTVIGERLLISIAAPIPLLSAADWTSPARLKEEEP